MQLLGETVFRNSVYGIWLLIGSALSYLIYCPALIIILSLLYNYCQMCHI